MSAGVAVTTMLSILATVVIVGNTLICLIIKRNREMRYTKTELSNNFTVSPEVNNVCTGSLL